MRKKQRGIRRRPTAHRNGYNPYLGVPPRSRQLRSRPNRLNLKRVPRAGRRQPSSKRSITSTRTLNHGSPEKKTLSESIVDFRERHSKRRRKAKKTITTLHQIDYGDAYKPPSFYYLQDSKHGKIYTCPGPKRNLTHFNEDPTLGGECFRPGGPTFGGSTFNKDTRDTPHSDMYKRVIPWDHKEKDYVYGAVQDACFRGFYDRRSLKSKIDNVRNEGNWDPVTAYNRCLMLSVALLVLMVIGWVVAAFLNRSMFWKYRGGWVLSLLVLVMFVVAIVVLCKVGSNSRTKRRYQLVHKACEEVNERNLKGSGVIVAPGPSAAWIEVLLDPVKTHIKGDIRHDQLSYNKLNYPNGRPKVDGKTVETIKKGPHHRVIIEESTMLNSSPNSKHLHKIQKQQSQKPPRPQRAQNPNLNRHQRKNLNLLDPTLKKRNLTGTLNSRASSGRGSARFRGAFNRLIKNSSRVSTNRTMNPEYDTGSHRSYQRLPRDSQYQSNYSKESIPPIHKKSTMHYHHPNNKENLAIRQNTKNNHQAFYEKLKKKKEIRNLNASGSKSSSNIFKNSSVLSPQRTEYSKKMRNTLNQESLLAAGSSKMTANFGELNLLKPKARENTPRSVSRDGSVESSMGERHMGVYYDSEMPMPELGTGIDDINFGSLGIVPDENGGYRQPKNIVIERSGKKPMNLLKPRNLNR